MAPSQDELLRVVVHVDDADPDRWRLALRNVANLLADVGSAQVELVFNGPAIAALTTTSPLFEELAAVAPGVRVLACRNSMAGAGLHKADLVPSAEVVPAGISHLVRRQHEGWAYVRP